MLVFIAVYISSVSQEQSAHVYLPLVRCVHQRGHAMLPKASSIKKKKNVTSLDLHTIDHFYLAIHIQYNYQNLT